MQTKIITGLILTLTIIVFIAVYWATESGRQQAAVARMQEESVHRGGEAYHSFCGVCHGDDGESIPEVVLRNTVLDEDVLARVIERGISGTAMPAFGQDDGGPLTEHQVSDLITFLKHWDDSFYFEEESGAHSEKLIRESENSLTEEESTNTIDAETIYSSSCAACHGTDKQGVSGLAPALTRDSLSASSGSELAKVISSGIQGSMMPPFGDRLTQQEIDALVELLLK